MDEHASDLNLLHALDLFLTERSVTRAAKRLGITQSAASHKLQKLREKFGDPLLVPTSEGLVATSRALALQQPLRDALRKLEEAVQNGANFDPKVSTRRFVVSMPDYGEVAFMPAVIQLLAQEAPQVKLWTEPPRADLLARLEAGTVDMAILPSVPQSAGIRHRVLFREGFSTMLRSGHPDAQTSSLSLERYVALNHLLVAPRGDPGSLVDDALANLGHSRNVVLRIANFAPAPFLVASSDLVSTVPTGIALVGARWFGLKVFEPPIPLPSSDSYMIWHERSQRDTGHVWLREITYRVASNNSINAKTEPDMISTSNVTKRP